MRSTVGGRRGAAIRPCGGPTGQEPFGVDDDRGVAVTARGVKSSAPITRGIRPAGVGIPRSIRRALASEMGTAGIRAAASRRAVASETGTADIRASRAPAGRITPDHPPRPGRSDAWCGTEGARSDRPQSADQKCRLFGVKPKGCEGDSSRDGNVPTASSASDSSATTLGSVSGPRRCSSRRCMR